MAENDDKTTDERIGLHSLKPNPGSRKPRKRIGRGEGSVTGKTSCRGHKGAGARTGSKDRTRFEGGQMPLHMRMRKLRGPTKKMSMPFERSEEHTSELQSRQYLVCRLLLEQKTQRAVLALHLRPSSIS